jgi:hypothetical protein
MMPPASDLPLCPDEPRCAVFARVDNDGRRALVELLWKRGDRLRSPGCAIGRRVDVEVEALLLDHLQYAERELHQACAAGRELERGSLSICSHSLFGNQESRNGHVCFNITRDGRLSCQVEQSTAEVRAGTRVVRVALTLPSTCYIVIWVRRGI